ncbi:MAG: trypsin-like serine protease [Pseudolactococcus laudensis]
MKKRKSNLVFLAAVALLSICLTSETEAADWDIVAAPGSEQITTPTPETTNNSLPAFEGTGITQESDVVFPIPDATTFPTTPESIIGTDDRSIVSNTTLFPYRTSCFIVTTFPDAIKYCSGNLVSSDTILTAGHCIYDETLGGWATSIAVYPARNGFSSPFGKVNAKSFYVSSEYLNLSLTIDKRREYDLGHIKLDQKIGKTTGWLGLTKTLSNDITLTGFPTPKNRDYKMYTQKGKLKNSSENNIFYGLDTEGGQSGSAVYNTNNNIIGVHTNGDVAYNWGTRMNAKNFETTKKIADTAMLSYRSHVQNIGWQGWVNDTGTTGTTGQSKRLEAINLNLSDSSYSGNIEYRTHVQDIGWQTWQKNGAMAGTTGQSKRLEALEIRLTGDLAKNYNIRYRSHVQSIGWQAWKSNGQMTGTTGQSLRLEAIQIQLVKK